MYDNGVKPPGAPFEEIQASSREILRQLYVPQPPPLFHYTTADGLFGILRSDELRASSYAFMNDRSEFTYGANLLRAVIEERARSPLGETDQDYYEAILRSRNPIVSDLYLVCFCAERDLLSQWRGYGGAGSRYCIQFDPAGFTKLHGASPLLPVLYDQDEQRKLLMMCSTRISEASQVIPVTIPSFTTRRRPARMHAVSPRSRFSRTGLSGRSRSGVAFCCYDRRT